MRASSGTISGQENRPARRGPDLEELAAGVLAGDRAMLGRAITLVESNRESHRSEAQELLARLMGHAGASRRVGITGVPGVGKSTFIEALGMHLVAQGHRVAVLAVDPSSAVTGGAILGDKTRMGRLAVEDRAFVRPSPSGGSLGGVARKSRETLLLCEAAGYDVVLVETVGVGQSEIVVAEMVDSVLLLLLPGAGDELQGIKRGILELIDVVAVNKADGAAMTAARQARVEYSSALQLIRPADERWRPPVLLASGLTGDGVDAVWRAVEDHRSCLENSGALEIKRRRQQLGWMWSLVEERLLASFRDSPGVRELLPSLETRVAEGSLSPTRAAEQLLHRYLEASRRQPSGDG